MLLITGSGLKIYGAKYASAPPTPIIERVEPWDTLDDAVGGFRYDANGEFGRYVVRGLETQALGGVAIGLASMLAQAGFRRRRFT